MAPFVIHLIQFFVYNILEIKLTTHDAGGVTELDFKLAEVMESIVEVEE